MICHGLCCKMTPTMVQMHEMEEKGFGAQLPETIKKKNSGMKERGFVLRQPTKEKAVLIVEELTVCSTGGP